MPNIILASKSPRRRELLRQMGLKFAVVARDIPEKLAGKDPGPAASNLAMQKALAVVKEVKEGLIIGADTIVVYNKKILGKPQSPLQAREMLLMLSGQRHQVFTGLGVVDVRTGGCRQAWAETAVFFRRLTKHEIDSYVESGEPRDKAGAYGIQGKGALFVTRIEGCFYNVVGLPITLLAQILEDFGVKVF